MSRLRNYWIYSLGLAVAWAIVLVVVSLAKPQSEHSVVVAFLGFGIGWITTTIARYVYPPAKRWRTPTDTATKEN